MPSVEPRSISYGHLGQERSAAKTPQQEMSHGNAHCSSHQAAESKQNCIAGFHRHEWHASREGRYQTHQQGRTAHEPAAANEKRRGNDPPSKWTRSWHRVSSAVQNAAAPKPRTQAALNPPCREAQKNQPAELSTGWDDCLRTLPLALDHTAYTPENGCLALSFLETISSAEGSFFIARAMESLVAS